MLVSFLLSSIALAQAESHSIPPVQDLSPGIAAPVAPGRMPIAVPAVHGRLPRGVTSFGCVQSDGWVYVLGGYFGIPHEYSREFQSRDFYRFRADQPGHLELLPFEHGLQSAVLLSWKGRILHVGGMTIENAKGEEQDMNSLDSVALFDPLLGEWSHPFPPMPAPRSSLEAVVLDGQLVVVGGWRLGNGEPTWFDDTWVLDLEDPRADWRSIPTPFRKRALALVVHDGSIAAFGGIHDEGRIGAELWRLDLATETWSSGVDFPGAGFAPAACVLDDRLVASGRDGGVYSQAAAGEPWQFVADQLCPRMFHRLVAVDDNAVLALGGISSGGRPVVMERVEWGPDEARGGIQEASALREAPTGLSSFEVPFPGMAKNRQLAFQKGHELYLFGGNNSTEQHAFGADNFVDEGWVLNLTTLEWSPVADYPGARQSMRGALSTDGAHGFAVGGFGDGELGAETYAEAFRYSFEDNAWETDLFEDVPPRSQFLLAEDAGSLWIFGGQYTDDESESAGGTTYTTEVYRSDPTDSNARRFVKAGAQLPVGRCAFAGAVHGGSAYLVGGMREDFELIETCDRFDFASRSFHPMPSPKEGRLGAKLVPVGSHLYLVGGYSWGEGDQLFPNRTIEVFDPVTETWSLHPERLPEDPRQIHAFAYEGRLWVTSTHHEEGSKLQVVILEPVRA